MPSSNIPSPDCARVAPAALCDGKSGGTTESFGDHDLPILDAAILDELEEDLADYGLMSRYAADFAALWTDRLGRLAAAVEVQDWDAALDAAISMKVSSAMIGGLKISRQAETMERAIRTNVLENGTTMLAVLAETGVATLKEIELRYSSVS
ncbi:MAG TPA: Hpt domain-containing protein [Arthrobacter sp.]|nr:Hpt domain-containing protein [Arthrobacter sp.]